MLTGANGYDTFDQMQYLARIRDAGSLVLVSNLWRISATPHDYLQPARHDPTGAFRRRILRESKTTFVIEPCGAPSALRRALAPVTTVAARFGCLTVARAR